MKLFEKLKKANITEFKDIDINVSNENLAFLIRTHNLYIFGSIGIIIYLMKGVPENVVCSDTGTVKTLPLSPPPQQFITPQVVNQPIIQPVGQVIKEPTQPVGQTVKEPIQPVGQTVKEPIQPVGQTVKEPIQPVGQVIKEPIQPVGQTVKELIPVQQSQQVITPQILGGTVQLNQNIPIMPNVQTK